MNNKYDYTAKQKGIAALVVLLLCAVLLCVYPLLGLREPQSNVLYALLSLLGYGFLVLPVIIACRYFRLTFTDVGLYSSYLLLSLIAGAIMLVLAIFVAPEVMVFLFGNVYVLSFRLFWIAALSGIFEEFLFRGYLQSRLCAWLGRWGGILLCSALFALFHIPARIYTGGLSVQNALYSIMILFPAGIMYSLFTLPFKNIYAAACLHAAANIMIYMLPF